MSYPILQLLVQSDDCLAFCARDNASITAGNLSEPESIDLMANTRVPVARGGWLYMVYGWMHKY